MKIRFYEDPETGLPHIFGHSVSEEEVREAFKNAGEDRKGDEDSRVLNGQSDAGRYLRVIYKKFQEEIFVLTSYELTGKSLHAFKRRRKRK